MAPIAGAALNGHEECVRVILEWVGKHCPGSTPIEWKTICMNAMICAMARGHLNIMRMLLPSIDVNFAAPGFNGYTPLHFAVLTQNIEAVKLLNTDSRLDSNMKSTNGRTPLALAGRMGSRDLIQELWACGASPVDPLAAMEALVEGHDAIFKLLCQKRSDGAPGGLFSRDSSGYSFFDRILFGCVREMASYERARPRQKTRITKIEDIDAYEWIAIRKPIYVASPSQARFVKLGTMLLDPDNRAIIEEPGHSDGEICIPIETLFLAMETCSCTLLKSLLRLCPAASCDVDSRGRTILMAAFVRGNPNYVELILKTIEEQKNKTVVNAISEAGDSALSLAIWNGKAGYKECLLSLLSFSGLDLRPLLQEDNKGEYPLMALAILAAEHSTSPLQVMKPKKTRRLAGTCYRIFNALIANLESDELSNIISQFSERQFCQTGVRLTDAMSELLRPGCLEKCLQACPALRSQLHTPDTNGMTSLIHASRNWACNATIMFLLKIPEMNVGHRDVEGRTALSRVAQNLGQFSDGGVAEVLIEKYGQDPLEVDKYGWSALRYAVCNGNVWQGSPYERLLRDADTPMEWTDEHDSTPLHLAIKGGSPLAIKLLLQHSSSSSWLNTPDADGVVPLAHFFSVSQTSKYMNNYRMRLPYSGTERIVSILFQAHKHKS